MNPCDSLHKNLSNRLTRGEKPFSGYAPGGSQSPKSGPCMSLTFKKRTPFEDGDNRRRLSRRLLYAFRKSLKKKGQVIAFSKDVLLEEQQPPPKMS